MSIPIYNKDDVRTKKGEGTKSGKWKLTPRILLDKIGEETNLRLYNAGFYFFNNNTRRWDNRGVDFIKNKAQKIADSIKTSDSNCSGDVGNNVIKEILGFIERRYKVDINKVTKNLIGVANGVLNIDSKELITDRDFIKNNFVPVQINANFNPDIRFEDTQTHKFINDILEDPETGEVLIDEYLTMGEIFGYPLMSGYSIKKAVLFLGQIHSGKTTLFDVMTDFYTKDNISGVSIYDFGTTFRPVKMVGKLINAVSDIGYKYMTDRAIDEFMTLTGNDKNVLVEEKYMPAFSYDPSAKLYFGSNWTPYVNTNNTFFLDRWIIIMLMKQFSIDPTFQDKLRTADERSGLLNFALEGHKRLIDNKSFTLKRSIDEIKSIFQNCRMPKEAEEEVVKSPVNKLTDSLGNPRGPYMGCRIDDDKVVQFIDCEIYCPECKKSKVYEHVAMSKTLEFMNGEHKNGDGNICKGRPFMRPYSPVQTTDQH